VILFLLEDEIPFTEGLILEGVEPLVSGFPPEGGVPPEGVALEEDVSREKGLLVME
jgi:hypothetical protein